MPDMRAEEKRTVRFGHCPAAGPGPDDGPARDPAQRRRARMQARAGAGQGLGAARRRLVRCREDDPGAVADGGGQACGGLEPGADRRPLPQGGHPDGGPGVDMPMRPRRQEGRGPALPVPAPPREEAGPEGRAPFGPGPHPGPRGHLRASGDRGGEGAGRRPGGGHDRRQGPQRRAGALAGRASNCTLLQRVGRKTAAAVGAALLEMLLPLAALARTITADNGKEFAGHAWVARALGAGFLFATPCHSRERGLNGHANGLVRGCFPGTPTREDHRRGGEAVRDRTDARPGKAHGCTAPARRSGRRGLPDRSRPGSRSGGTGPARERGVCGPPTSVGLRPPFARRAAAAPWARLAPSGERGYAAFRRDFSRLGPRSPVSGGLDRHHKAIFCARAARSLRKWPVLHFGVEVGLHFPKSLPDAGDHLEYSIEGSGHFPWQIRLFVESPSACPTAA